MGQRISVGQGGLLGLALVLGLGVFLAWLSSATPRALPAEAPADRFAAGRALQDIARIAALPHPSGSPQNARVRDTLVARLQALGLSPQLERATGVRPFDVKTSRTYTVENVLARVAGRDPAAPALLVMSHYDSVPGSPGAADDMAGVASALEMIRLLQQGPQPFRDVLFAFTDGEEIGLNGASVLFNDAAVFPRIGFVLNMETRGGGGRALMFQTGRAAGGAIRLFSASARRPESDSLMAFLYEKMPNDTDFSVALAKGLPGLNYAFIGRPALYHTPAAVPSAVEPGAVQSLGEQVYGMARAVALAKTLPAATPSPTWFDVLGRWVMVYDPPLGWAPLLLAGALLGLSIAAQARAGELTPLDLLVGAGQVMAATLLAAAALLLYGRLAVPLHRGGDYYRALAHAGMTETVAALAILLSALAVFRAGPPPARPLGRWAGALGVGWLLALLLQIAAPRTAFVAEWPTLLAAGGLLAMSRQGLRLWCAVLLCGLSLAMPIALWHGAALGVGVLLPAAAAAFAPLAFVALSPWLQRQARLRAPGVTSALF